MWIHDSDFRREQKYLISRGKYWIKKPSSLLAISMVWVYQGRRSFVQDLSKYIAYNVLEFLLSRIFVYVFIVLKKLNICLLEKVYIYLKGN